MATSRHNPANKKRFAIKLAVLIILCVYSVSAESVFPTLTLNPKEFKLKDENASSTESMSVQCSRGSGKNTQLLSSVKAIRISHKGEAPDSKEETVAEATEIQKKAELKGKAEHSNKYSVTGTLSTGPTSTDNPIGFGARQPDCEDAGRYRCTMVYNTVNHSSEQTTYVDGYIYVSPYSFEVSRTPNKTIISVGDELSLSCTAVVGTLRNDELTENSKLVWVFRPRDTAAANVFTKLEKELEATLNRVEEERVHCSQRQTVSLKVKVDEVRDSKRDYFCVAARFKLGNLIVYAGGSANNISMPSFEKPKASHIGIGGFVGIGLGGLALLTGIIFGGIWCVRRKKKKMERTEEIERRKSMIDDRRKSITTIVEKRKSMISLAERDSGSEPESSVAESSVAESSVAESSVAESSVAETSVVESTVE